jgi:hypothetical protein
VSRVKGAVIHWPGTTSSKPITSQAAVASALRGWQAYHMDERGWSDIAYQVAVDQAGRAWTLRGLRTQSGANGNNAANEDYGAILLVLVQGEAPSEAMKATTRAVIADFRKIYPNGTAIRPHADVRKEYTGDGTDCPGPAATAALRRGEFTPRTTEELSVSDIRAITDAITAGQRDLKASIDGLALRLEQAIETSTRRWALWAQLYEIEIEDDRANAQRAYEDALKAGKSVEEAMAAASAELATLRQNIKDSQATL